METYIKAEKKLVDLSEKISSTTLDLDKQYSSGTQQNSYDLIQKELTNSVEELSFDLLDSATILTDYIKTNEFDIKRISTGVDAIYHNFGTYYQFCPLNNSCIARLDRFNYKIAKQGLLPGKLLIHLLDKKAPAYCNPLPISPPLTKKRATWPPIKPIEEIKIKFETKHVFDLKELSSTLIQTSKTVLASDLMAKDMSENALPNNNYENQAGGIAPVFNFKAPPAPLPPTDFMNANQQAPMPPVPPSNLKSKLMNKLRPPPPGGSLVAPPAPPEPPELTETAPPVPIPPSFPGFKTMAAPSPPAPSASIGGTIPPAPPVDPFKISATPFGQANQMPIPPPPPSADPFSFSSNPFTKTVTPPAPPPPSSGMPPARPPQSPFDPFSSSATPPRPPLPQTSSSLVPQAFKPTLAPPPPPSFHGTMTARPGGPPPLPQGARPPMMPPQLPNQYGQSIGANSNPFGNSMLPGQFNQFNISTGPGAFPFGNSIGPGVPPQPQQYYGNVPPNMPPQQPPRPPQNNY